MASPLKNDSKQASVSLGRGRLGGAPHAHRLLPPRDGYASADRRFLRAVGRDAESPVPAQIRPSSGLDDAVNHEPPRGAVAPSGMPLWSNDPQMWPSASSARCADECVYGL